MPEWHSRKARTMVKSDEKKTILRLNPAGVPSIGKNHHALLDSRRPEVPMLIWTAAGSPSYAHLVNVLSWIGHSYSLGSPARAKTLPGISSHRIRKFSAPARLSRENRMDSRAAQVSWYRLRLPCTVELDHGLSPLRPALIAGCAPPHAHQHAIGRTGG